MQDVFERQGNLDRLFSAVSPRLRDVPPTVSEPVVGVDRFVQVDWVNKRLRPHVDGSVRNLSCRVILHDGGAPRLCKCVDRSQRCDYSTFCRRVPTYNKIDIRIEYITSARILGPAALSTS